MKLVNHQENIRIFGMIYPLYTVSDLNPGKIEADLNELQAVMNCRVETASDIVSILRYMMQNLKNDEGEKQIYLYFFVLQVQLQTHRIFIRM